MKTKQAGGLILSLFVAASSHASPKAALRARGNEEKQITVRVRKYAPLEPGVLLKAETTANKILREAGVDTVWVLCFDGSARSGDVACTDPRGPMNVTVNVLPISMSQAFRLRGEAFGMAAEDGELGFGCDAWIFNDPIANFAVERELSAAQLFGHVLAHELGHLLLGPNSHSGVGLMRAQWSSRELHAVDQGGLFFSASESERIQKAVLARWQAVPRGSKAPKRGK
jgi:hypothetical protein